MSNPDQPPASTEGDETRAFLHKTRRDIRSGASLTLAYMLMNMLAACIATYGLFVNSPAVVIGAMIVAMLLGPIMGAGLALVDADLGLLIRSTVALAAGTLGVITVAAVLGLVHQDSPITAEIMARTAPNVMDLMVALAGGAAGAYATINPRLSIAFVGVAIATALVPPLCSATILLVRGEYRLAFGAYLLTFTNMVAIQFASSLVLWLTGFRQKMPIVAFFRRNLAPLLMMAALGGVLTFNLVKTVRAELFQTAVTRTIALAMNDQSGAYVAAVRFEQASDRTLVRAVVRGPKPPTPELVSGLEASLPSPPDGTRIELRVRFVTIRVIASHGELFVEDELAPAL